MKTRQQQVLVGVLLALVLIILILQATAKPPLNWKESYDRMDKSPYGGRVFYEQFLKAIDPTPVKEIHVSTYEWLRSEPGDGTLLVFNSSFYSDKETTKRLLQWIEAGNTAFISARYMEERFLDSLGIKIQSIIELENFREHSSLFVGEEQGGTSNEFRFERITPLTYFSFTDSLAIQVLGSNKFADSTKDALPNFIQLSYGEGQVLLHLFPLAFSNYFLLDKENKTYTEAILGYLPMDQPIFYDHYIKNGKSIFASPMYLFLSNQHLKWAYYSVVAMLLCWIVFEGRRKQRSIPVIKPLANQTVDFAETIASMYLEKKAYHENILQQITLFLEYCRNTFRVSTETIDEEVIQKIAARSGYPLEKTRELFAYVAILEHKKESTQADVIALHKKINEFKLVQHGRK
ncbi:DUF4350 domain-containing protein [Mongoliitalea lutea]|uniref:DUF4350 domain-containing protein n=1 Tax=Mongoliitalea lutea TaxID=849756 RepID=A0A8J3D0D4_9BACT|nr:DUF4350 domain-containing protein [Mongoliitalea lutea]GHB42176.1 hypothetical protein GCM10008106_23980 [Mongoliitalea lutea]